MARHSRVGLEAVEESEFSGQAFLKITRGGIMKKILLLTAVIYALHLGLPVINATVSLSQAQEEPAPKPEPKPKPESEFESRG